MGLLDRIHEANHHHPEQFVAFFIQNQRYGFIHRDRLTLLEPWPHVFQLSPERVTLHNDLDQASLAIRSAAVEEVLRHLHHEGHISSWRDEPYRINHTFPEPPVLIVDRGALAFLGLCGYGVHMNGYCWQGGELFLWVARRSLDRGVDPGKLDQLVAGGQPAHLGLRDNLAKECAEEADIPPALVASARSVSAISYCLQTPAGLRPDILFNFDLALPADFIPRNTDGEVEDFRLWPVAEVVTVLRNSQDFKFNCALVAMDFLIRHGIITPEEPDYLALIAGLTAREAALARLPG